MDPSEVSAAQMRGVVVERGYELVGTQLGQTAPVVEDGARAADPGAGQIISFFLLKRSARPFVFGAGRFAPAVSSRTFRPGRFVPTVSPRTFRPRIRKFIIFRKCEKF